MLRFICFMLVTFLINYRAYFFLSVLYGSIAKPPKAAHHGKPWNTTSLDSRYAESPMRISPFQALVLRRVTDNPELDIIFRCDVIEG